jgi:hypothetical protein
VLLQEGWRLKEAIAQLNGKRMGAPDINGERDRASGRHPQVDVSRIYATLPPSDRGRRSHTRLISTSAARGRNQS